MNYTNEMIVGKLEAYNSVKEKLALLCYELSHPAQITDEDYLEAVAVGSSRMDSSTKNCGPNLDKTLGLALSYREKVDRLNAEVVSEVFREWQELQTEINRLDFYMGLLSVEHRQVLQKSAVQFDVRDLLQHTRGAVQPSHWKTWFREHSSSSFMSMP